MCWIVAYYGRITEIEKNKLKELVRQSKVRGLHAFWYVADGVSHKFHSIDDCLASMDGITGCRYFVFHNRYSTSGDYADHNNNQPIEHGNKYLVFNWVISQATKQENEARFGMKLLTDNDWEVLLQYIWQWGGVTDFFRQNNGSFAWIVVFDEYFLVYRNPERPLHRSGQYFASTWDIFKRAWIRDSVEIQANQDIVCHF